ncbi:MAG: hypothetical protein WBR15_02370 [Gammaproteobacteria bacterium]
MKSAYTAIPAILLLAGLVAGCSGNAPDQTGSTQAPQSTTQQAPTPTTQSSAPASTTQQVPPPPL